MNNIGTSFPNPPQFTEDEIATCRESGDYRPILFEWYKYVGVTTNLAACIDLLSPAAKQVSKSHFGVLIGLLNRCSRLMLANVKLSHGGLYGETTAVIDRCVFESCVKVLWLCQQNSNEAFCRFIADGLKTELDLRTEIQTRIAQRGGIILPIEERMLSSISRYLKTSGLTDVQISEAKKLPNLASMLDSIGHDRLTYVVGQKIGSHHVHGTWPSLLLHYLNWDESGNFHPRDHNVSTHVNQYVFIPLTVIGAVKAFSSWLMKEPEASALLNVFQAMENEILAINREVIGEDFSLAEET